jgi:hypothetical protein
MDRPGRIYRSATTVLSLAMVVIGIALVIRTVAAHGALDASGVLIGCLFVIAGALRLYGQIRVR